MLDFLRQWVAARILAIAAGTAVVSCAGCGDHAKPDAIWCETGTGPNQVVYPRGIAYKSADDTFKWSDPA